MPHQAPSASSHRLAQDELLSIREGSNLALSRNADDATTLGIRPEHITVAQGSGVKFADVRVDLVENLGGQR
jgi:ABC-type sugar transport system ATPase subunit